jgi:CRP/FNR family cyclic AMP-dependent transcriptional regulator
MKCLAKPSTTAARRVRAARGSLVYPKGTRVFDAQHPPRHVYLVRQGIVQLSNDSDVILDHVRGGEFFGEKLLLPDSASPQTATTVSRARVQPFGKRELLDGVHHDRRFASKLLKGLAKRIDCHEQSICEFAREPVARRLALVLLRLLPERPASGWVRLPWNPTNPEMARRIGTTRWRISRLVNQFRRQGWLRREDGLWVHREGLDAFLHSTQPTE